MPPAEEAGTASKTPHDPEPALPFVSVISSAVALEPHAPTVNVEESKNRRIEGKTLSRCAAPIALRQSCIQPSKHPLRSCAKRLGWPTALCAVRPEVWRSELQTPLAR